MKQYIVGSLFIALALCGTNGMAQFGGSATQLARNYAKLQRFTSRKVAATLPHVGVPPVRVPAHILPSGTYVTLRSPLLPRQGNLVNASYLYKHQTVLEAAKRKGLVISTQQVQDMMAREWVVNSKGDLGTGRAFYEDQTSLAQDLNAFYEGSGVAVEVQGKLAKLYALPVDGILYKPAGYSEPVVLTAEADFVLYYPQTKTGQLVKNTPQLRALLNHPTRSGGFEQTVTLGGASFNMPQGEPEGTLLQELPHSTQPAAATPTSETVNFVEVNGAPLQTSVAAQVEASVPLQTPFRPLVVNERIVAQLRSQHANDAKWELQVDNKNYTSQNMLGLELAVFYYHNAPQVYQRLTGRNYYVYELPVDGITYGPQGVAQAAKVLDPEKYVVLYNENTGGQIVERKALYNALIFDLVQE